MTRPQYGGRFQQRAPVVAWTLLAMVLCLSGCAYNVQPAATKAVNIYSSYENKVPGKWVIVFELGVRDLSRDVKPASYVCSAHHYPVQFGDSLAISLKHTFQALVEDVEERSTLPTTDELIKMGAVGSAVVRVDDFSPRLTCSMGFWSGSCTATADLTSASTLSALTARGLPLQPRARRPSTATRGHIAALHQHCCPRLLLAL